MATTKRDTTAAPQRPTLGEAGYDWLRALWYGDGGKGKTTSLATLANRGRLVLVTADPGLKAKALKRRGVNIDNIEPMFKDEVSFAALEDLFWELKERLEEDPTSVLGVGWDSVTEMVDIFVEHSVQKGIVKAERAGRERDRFDTYKEDYGVMTEQIRSLLRMYQDLPCHFGVTALTRRDVDEEGSVRVGPATNPALQGDLIGYMDVILYCKVEDNDTPEGEYIGVTKPTGRFEAKDRFGMLPRNLVDPSFERLLDYIVDESVTAEDDPLQKAARERRARQDTKS